MSCWVLDNMISCVCNISYQNVSLCGHLWQFFIILSYFVTLVSDFNFNWTVKMQELPKIFFSC